ncbi:hypothetical protein ACNQUF_11835, partial [Corynebacterium diphtheriae]
RGFTQLAAAGTRWGVAIQGTVLGAMVPLMMLSPVLGLLLYATFLGVPSRRSGRRSATGASSSPS